LGTVTGKFAEPRLYWRYVVAVFHPGVEVPTAAEPHMPSPDLSRMPAVDIDILIEEGRRQLDRQSIDLNSLQTRSTAVVTVTLAELALIIAGLRHLDETSTWFLLAWIPATAITILAAAGAVSVATSRAVMGRLDTAIASELTPPLRKKIALGYVNQVGVGEETIRTRLTVLRGSVTLAALGAILYAPVFAGLALTVDEPQTVIVEPNEQPNDRCGFDDDPGKPPRFSHRPSPEGYAHTCARPVPEDGDQPR
jgi:hypothetical protein